MFVSCGVNRLAIVVWESSRGSSSELFGAWAFVLDSKDQHSHHSERHELLVIVQASSYCSQYRSQHLAISASCFFFSLWAELFLRFYLLQSSLSLSFQLISHPAAPLSRTHTPRNASLRSRFRRAPRRNDSRCLPPWLYQKPFSSPIDNPTDALPSPFLASIRVHQPTECPYQNRVLEYRITEGH